MNAEKAIHARLAAVAGVSSLVGSRIYPVKAPQNATFPLVVYQRISGERDDPLADASGLCSARIQISCHASGTNPYDGVKALASQVRQALQKARGTFGGVVVDDITIETDQDIYDPQTEDFFVAIDVIVWHRE